MRNIIRTEKAPAAIGPYSQAIRIDCTTLVFCSGQIGIDPKTGELVGKTSSEQCQQILDNITALLKAAGGDLSKVIKATIYMTDIRDFGPVNEMYSTYFDVNPPTRTTVEVSRLPKEAKIEIDIVAAL